jgi:plasmid replication initiation protein
MRDIMWCARGPSGRLLKHTISNTRGEVFTKLFQLQSNEFQSKYWKRWEAGLEAYRKAGYKVIRVVIIPVTELKL